jgi:hypothetical protein
MIGVRAETRDRFNLYKLSRQDSPLDRISNNDFLNHLLDQVGAPSLEELLAEYDRETA